jgi:Rho GTPase-activating protein 11
MFCYPFCPQDKAGKKKIFKIPLHNLELTDVNLSESESTQQIPLFVYESCNRILEHANTEGLFRKAGSTNRQKEIKVYIFFDYNYYQLFVHSQSFQASLEGGAKLNKSHHVIDVANLLKTFFRDLPEALLPAGNVQEALLRCLLVADNKIPALMMTLLLLPPLSLNTLSYFMQFLQKVAKHSDRNKMTKENIAIIIAPNIMPISEMIQQRLAGHVKVIELLIENAHKIGIIPDEMLNRLEDSLGSLKNLPQASMLSTTDKKKKKRRSGSLTRMFNGIRKIVGAIGSSESLEKTPDPDRDRLVATPYMNKSAKKRKVESVNPFSAKKRYVCCFVGVSRDSLIIFQFQKRRPFTVT